MRPIGRRLLCLSFVPSALATLALFLFSVHASAQDVHKDERLGFKLKVPRGWEQVPLRGDEQWIVGRYRSPKTETTVLEKTAYDYEHNPELQIVAFLHKNATPTKDPVPDEKPAGTGSGTDVKKVIGPKVYRNYPEYMRETYGRGHFIEKEESGTQAGLNVTKYEIKAEAELYAAEMRVIACVYETELADIAVQVEVMADTLKKHRSEIDDVMRSFAVIPCTQPFERPASMEAGFLSALELGKLTPAERKTKKIELQRQEFERVTKNLPKGWTASEIEGVFVINHCDEDFAKKVVDQILAIYGWLETTFPEVGKFEYARPPIVRICEDGDEEWTFRKGSGTYWVAGTDLVTHKNNKDWWDLEWDYIGSRTFQIWLQERDPKLPGALPIWLQHGLSEVVGGARLKAGKISFEMGDQEEWFRSYLPSVNDDSMSIRTLFTLTNDDFDSVSKSGDGKIWWQAVTATRFLVDSRSKKTRQILTDYMASLHQILAELETQDGKDKPMAPPKDEKEEELRFKQRQEWLKSRERALLDQSLARTFPGWTAADWKGLDREFRRSL